MTSDAESAAAPLRIGITGLGFMGRTHAGAWRRAAAAGAPVRLELVHDAGTPVAGGGNLDVAGDGDPLAGVERTADADAMFDADRLDVLDVCTPTDTHLELAARAVDAGLHVLVEKPVALDPEAIDALAARAAAAGRLVMPAMCMRFWPAWTRIAAAVCEERFGPVRAAAFERLGAPPSWSPDFYLDPARSGGAVADLHVHDVDFVHALFGPPDRVEAAGDLHHVTSVLGWEDSGRHVVCRGGWLRSPAFPFRMRALVECAEAVLDFDVAREAPLLVHDRDGTRPLGPEGEAAAAEGTGYDGEVRALAAAITGGAAAPPVTLGDAAAVMRTIARIRDRLGTG